MTSNRLSTVNFSQDHISKIIQNLESGKAHGHDNFNIRMLKIYITSILKPLETIFQQCLDILVDTRCLPI